MIYGSVCSGIEAATVAWDPLGWKAAWLSEIEPFPCAVLKHHYPKTPNLGDMTRIHETKEFRNRAIDLLVGGTPCQSFSVAGLRKGMADPRGNLALVFLALLNRSRPSWVVWENVPGVLSSWSDEAGNFKDERGGRERGWQSNDFDTFTSGLRELGYGLAWRILDAQYFGVPQRRQRVFVVGYLGDWRRAAAVLFEQHSLSGNPPPSRKEGQQTPREISHSFKASGGFKQDVTHETYVTHTLRGEGYDASEDGTGRGTPIIPILEAGARVGTSQNDPRAGMGIGKPGDPMFTLQSGKQHAVFDMRGNGDGEVVPTMTGDHLNRPTDYTPMVFESRFARNGRGAPDEIAPPLKAQSGESGKGDAAPLLNHGSSVRRLTPRECERLQGFPDDYTLVPWRGKESSDGPRYKALGNSMAVPVMRWIGERIQQVEKIK